jgi:HSP20 family protein
MNIVRRPTFPTLPTSIFDWDPFRAFGDMLPRTALATREDLTTYVPSFDVKETPEIFEVRADMPGVQERDLEISLHGSHLTVSGKREEERRTDKDRMHLYERTYGAFTRSFALPEGIDEGKIFAELKQGVLTLQLPKRAQAQAKRIAVKAS